MLASFAECISSRLENAGFEVLDPWNHGLDEEIKRVISSTDVVERKTAIETLSRRIGVRNENLIQRSDGIFAVLDGAEVDSGVAAEIGYGYGLGKPVCGLRTDVRDMGDLPGLAINLQVLRFIEASGGVLIRSVEEITEATLRVFHRP